VRRLASARVEWRPLFLPRQQLNSRVLSFGSPSGWRDQMTFASGAANSYRCSAARQAACSGAVQPAVGRFSPRLERVNTTPPE